jgi:hypothetical protein
MSIASIAVLTMQSNPALREFVASTPLNCVICGEEGALDFLLNIIFFAPLGAGLYLAGMPPVLVIAAGGGLSLTVETIQYLLLVGRDASLGDLLSNTLGTALGAVLAHGAWSGMVPDHAAARRRLALAACLGYAGLAIGGWALAPSTSSSGTWRVRTAFEAPDAVPFRGTIDEFSVGAMTITPGIVGDPSALRAELSQPERVVTIRGRGALVTDPQSWLGELDADGHVEVLLGQEWCAFTFSGRRRAFDLRLHEADIFVETPCRDSLEAPFEVRALQSSSRVQLSAKDLRGEWSAIAPLYLATGWVSFWPYADHLVPRRPLAEVIWIALLLLPAGIWLAPAAIGAIATVALILASTITLYLLTAAFGLFSVQPLHVAAVPLGIAAGWVTRVGWRGVLRRS